MPFSALVALSLAASIETCPTAAARTAKGRYARADYLGAIAALADVEVCPDGNELELADAFRWRAQAKASSGDEAGALEAWALTWTVSPTYALDPLESPKFQDQYAAARSRAAREGSVFARLVRTLAGRAVVQVFDPTRRVRRVAVLFDHVEINAPLEKDGLYHAIVPDGALSARAVLESGDAVVFRSLTVTLSELPQPRDAVVVGTGSSAATRRAVVVVGAVAAAVAIAGLVTAIALNSRHVDGSLGRVELP